MTTPTAEAPTTGTGTPWQGCLTLEGVMTSDGRLILTNETSWRELPLSLMVMTKSSHGGMPSTETVVGGRIDTIERRPAPAGTVLADGQTQAFELWATGVLNDDENGRAAASAIGNQSLRGVSIDFGATENIVVTEEDEDGWPVDYYVEYSAVEIMAATVCPTPAFAGGYIELVDQPAEQAPVDEAAGAVVVDLVASAALPGLNPQGCVPCGSSRAGLVASGGIPVDPPAAWFDDPQLAGPTALTIGTDGRIVGHLATWNECHVGVSGQCITPPRSTTSYARFRVASCLTAEGTLVPTGTLFMGTAHAPIGGTWTASVVQDHYADTGQAVADVACGEDDYGIWVSGAIRPDLTPAQLRAARGSVLSGDWRETIPGSGRLELVAALHVNTPGFAVQRAQLAASAGHPVALVAAGASAAVQLARRQRQAQDGHDTDQLAQVVARSVQRALAPLLAPLAAAKRDQARQLLAAAQPDVEQPTERTRPVRHARKG